MYESLLDHDLEDETTVVADVATDIDDKALDDDDETDGLVEADDTDAAEADGQDAESEGLLEGGEGESWSDDPVRMYLTQMGEIPLLTRQAGNSPGARRSKLPGAAFRRKLLECDYVIQQAVKVLQRVHRGELPFDRTVQVSVTDRLEKDQILGRLPHNLATLDRAAQAESRTITALPLSKSHKPNERQGGLDAAEPASPPGRAAGRRAWSADAADRADDSHARRIQRAHRSSFAGQIDADEARQEAGRTSAGRWLIEYRNILRALQETPTSLRNRVKDLKVVYTRVSAGQARAVGRQLAAGRVDRQEVPQPRPVVPGSDSGRQRRPDAGGR